MNRKLSFLTALVAALVPVIAAAQTSPAPAAPAPAQAAPVALPAPQAVPAKIALIAFEQAVFATNEGQKTVQEVQAKYAPKKAQIDALAAEVDSLKKQLQAAPATLPDDERASRLKTIDTKEKQLNRDAEDATAAYNSDLQDAYGKLAQKVDVVLKKYVTDNGYTLLIDVSSQTSPVMWASSNPNSDVTEAVIAAYNAATPTVAAQPPAAPSATRPKPATTAPRSTTPPK